MRIRGIQAQVLARPIGQVVVQLTSHTTSTSCALLPLPSVSQVRQEYLQRMREARQERAQWNADYSAAPVRKVVVNRRPMAEPVRSGALKRLPGASSEVAAARKEPAASGAHSPVPCPRGAWEGDPESPGAAIVMRSSQGVPLQNAPSSVAML